MPPKPRFTRDEIVEAALALVSERGADALTARELADWLGCSTRPIFTAFDDMSALRREVRRRVAIHIEHVAKQEMRRSGRFLSAELRAITFAKDEPNLYKLVFMEAGGPLSSIEDVLLDSEIAMHEYTELLEVEYDLTSDEAEELFTHAWILANGMGSLCATRRVKLPTEGIARLLNEDLAAMCAHLKARRIADADPSASPSGREADGQT